MAEGRSLSPEERHRDKPGYGHKVMVNVDSGQELVMLVLVRVPVSATGEEQDIEFGLSFSDWDRIVAAVQSVRAEHEAALPVIAELLGALEPAGIPPDPPMFIPGDPPESIPDPPICSGPVEE